jgi:flagellar hook-length control protein FliK
MNNLPVITSTPQTAAKSAPLAAAPVTRNATSAPTSQPAKPSEESSPEGKSFGDVLAHQVQVSEAPPAEDKTQQSSTAKALTSAQNAKSNDDSVLLAPVLGDALTAQNADATPVEVASKSKQTVSKEDAIFAHFKAKNNVTKKSATPGEATANLPQGALAALIPPAISNPQPADLSASPKKTALADNNQNSILGMNPDQPGESQVLPASKNTIQLNGALPASAKKDAQFSNILDTVTASTTTKLASNDDKAAALAAAPQANASVQTTLLAATAPVASVSVMPVQLAINTPVTHDDWGDELSQKITWLSNQKEQTAELHLNPPQLGPMDIVLKVSGDQATALFTSPHAAVRDAVEQALPRLREMMAESGIMLGNATVSDQAPRGRQGDNDNKSSNSRTAIGRVSDASRAVNQNVRISPISRHNGIVDTFA